MPLSQKMTLRQNQSLFLTPKLQQSLKLLKLSNLELAEYLEKELERNPLLEPEYEQKTQSKSDDWLNSSLIKDLKAKDIENINNIFRPLPKFYSTLNNNFGNKNQPLPPTQTSEKNNHKIENNIIKQEYSTNETLKDHLTFQLGIEISNPNIKFIGMQLIDLVNDAGYLTESLESISVSIGSNIKIITNTLKELQKFDPIGVFARNLSECLTLQLKERNKFDQAMEIMINNLDLIAQNDIKKLSKLCAIDFKHIVEMIGEIKSLNPKPGLIYGNEIIQTIVPDIFVEEQTNGGWIVKLNNETLPKVLVNSSYYTKISQDINKESEKNYLSEILSSANWLVKAIEQRADTILKVATEITTQQNDFMKNGVKKLKPLKLKDIAKKIEMHDSTVSRVTANKYISTPQGIFPMKYFFTPGIPSTIGNKFHSAESVRIQIQKLIQQEKVGQNLSDDKIAEILRDLNINIARRTVTKYRKMQKIPSSIQRKKYNKTTKIRKN